MSSIIDKLFGPSDEERAAEAAKSARIEDALTLLAQLPQFVRTLVNGAGSQLVNVLTGCIASREGARLRLSWGEPLTIGAVGGGRVAWFSGDSELAKYVRTMQMQAAGLEGLPPVVGSPASDAAPSPAWSSHAYPLQHVQIDLQGTRHSSRDDVIEQLETVLTRLRDGDDEGEAHDDDFGYRFRYEKATSSSVFAKSCNHS